MAALEGGHALLWGLCFACWLAIALNYTFSLSFSGCAGQHGVALAACRAVVSLVERGFVPSFILLPLLTLAAVAARLVRRRWGWPERLLGPAAWGLLFYSLTFIGSS